jgi:dTDP-4-amino-4,6-dideoxygalactose transaminase
MGNDERLNELAPIEFSAVQTRLNEEEERALLRTLRDSDTFSVGPEGEAFEKEFTQFIGCADAVAVCSCSAALELAAVLSRLGPGDEVILPAHTFVSSAVPFARTGATLRWADIDPNTRVISVDSLRSLITSRTKVVVAVHLYGLALDMDAIGAIAEEQDLLVVEDCAQAPGARFRGKRVGSFGDFGCFSFHTQKNMTTLGEGGMLTVRDSRHAVQARKLRWMGNWPFEGQRERYWEPAMGNLVQAIDGVWPFNFCLGEPNAAVGRLLLRRLDRINEQRREQAARFMKSLTEFPELVFQAIPDGCEHVYHLMAARYDGAPYDATRDDLIELLYRKYRVKCIVQYWPLDRPELFRKFGTAGAEVPESDRFFDNMISFPWRSEMGNEMIDDMADRTRCALAELRAGGAAEGSGR